MPTLREYNETELTRELRVDRYVMRKLIVDVKPSTAPDPDNNVSALYHLAPVFQAFLAYHLDKNPPKMKAKDAAEIRALEARAKKLELQNEVQEAKYVLQSHVIVKDAQYAAELSKLLETVPMNIKRRLPDLSPEVVAAIDDELRIVQNAHVRPA